MEDICIDSIKSNRPFSTAIRVCGSNNFKWNILLESDDNELLKWYEKYCIKLYNTKTPYGYNVANGGQEKPIFGPIMSNQEEEFRCRVVYAEQNIEVYKILNETEFIKDSLWYLIIKLIILNYIKEYYVK